MSGMKPTLELLPPDVRERTTGLLALDAVFATGPSFVVRGRRVFDPPVPLFRAAAWLEARRRVYRKATILLEDGSVLWLGREKPSPETDEQRRFAREWREGPA